MKMLAVKRYHFCVGDRIRVNDWVIPREDAWKHGTVLEVVGQVATVDWGDYTSLINFGGFRNVQLVEGS